MADTTNTAEIRVVADASGVEAGLRPAIDAAQRAERAISGIGSNSIRSQQNLIQAIQRTTAQMEAGSRTGARYFEIIARQRGIDPAVLRPYLEQLRAVEEAQRRAGSSASNAATLIRDGLGQAIAGLSIAAFAQQVTSAQREFDKLNTALVTATGSTEGAKQAFASLQNFAATTPFGLQEVTSAFIKMKNLGLDPSEQALRSYGDTASAMGKTLEQFVEAVADATTGEFERLKEFGIKASQDGEKVSLMFRGVTTTIGNNATEIEKYLRRIGEVEFAGGMARQAATLDGAISNLGDSWESFLLKVSQSGFGDAAHKAVLALGEGINTLGNSIEAISGGLVTAGKIATGYFLAFTAAPAAFQLVATSIGRLQVQLALLRMEMAAGASVSSLFAGALGGVSVSALAASGALGVLKIAMGTLFALFAGWELGSWLRDNFVEARIAGTVFVGAMLNGWENIKYGATMAWEAIQFAWDKKVARMGESFAAYLSTVSKGLALVGAKDTSRQVEAYAERLRGAGNAQETFAERTAALTAAHKAEIEQINRVTDELVAYEIVADRVSQPTRGASKRKTSKDQPKGPSKEELRALKEYEALLDRINGVSVGVDPDFHANLSKLFAGYKAGKQTLEEYVSTVEKYIAQQPFVKKAEEDRLRAARELDEFTKRHMESLSAVSGIYAERIKEAEDEAKQNQLLAETFGMSKAAIEEQTIARLEDQLAQRSSLGLTLDEIEMLEKLISAKKRSVEALRNVEIKDAAKTAAEEWRRAAESIERSLTDALLRGFESGKGFGKNLVDTIKNMFNTLVLRPVISAVVNPAAGMITSALGLPSAASAATGGGSGIGGAASTLGTLGSLTSGVGLLGAGGLGLQAGFGALMSGGLAGIGGAISGGMAAIGAGTASSIAAGMGTIAGALGPIALGIGAAVAIWKKLDTSGTAHTGGASSASSAGVSTIRAESLGFQHTKVSNDVNSMTAQLASGIVSILDSTALAFGKTAGYTAATAFADDTSKDGAWGALLIQKMGSTVLDWNSTRSSKWAPKEFADGEKGQAQYLAALSSSVRTALNSIGLPEWARTMLNGIASDASIEDLAKVVEQINATQSALAAMRAQLVGFSSLSDSAVSALMAASGGIDKLFANASAFYDAFYSEAEKNAAASQQIATALAAVNLQMPTSRDGFRALVEAQMRLGTQGAEAVSVLLGVAGAFAQVTPEVQAATTDLTSYRSALTDAYNAESQALQATMTRMGSFAASLRNLRENALLGSLSPLSPSQKYAEAKSQYEAVLAAARAGDEGAQGRYQDVYTAFLEASRAVYASSTGYTRDFDYAQAATEEAAKWAEAQVDVGQAQLESLKASVSGLIEVNKSVLSVREAIQQLNEAMSKNTAPLTAVAPPVNAPIPYSSYGTSNTEALVAEVKALRTEVAGLRGDQNAQTGAMIKATYGAGEQMAGAVTTGARSAPTEIRVLPQ